MRNTATGTHAGIDAIAAAGGSQDCGIEHDPDQET
jgi:hypothetical protein